MHTKFPAIHRVRVRQSRSAVPARVAKAIHELHAALKDAGGFDYAYVVTLRGCVIGASNRTDGRVDPRSRPATKAEEPAAEDELDDDHLE